MDCLREPALKDYLLKALLPSALPRQPLLFLENYVWSWRRDLNPRPSDYKSDALPTELRQQVEASPYGHNTSPIPPEVRDNYLSYHKGI